MAAFSRACLPHRTQRLHHRIHAISAVERRGAAFRLHSCLGLLGSGVDTGVHAKKSACIRRVSESCQSMRHKRSFLTRFNEENVMELLGDSDDRKYMICSSYDEGCKSYASKKISQMGDEVILADLGIGFTCRKGLNPASANQDSWIVMQMDNRFSLYAVFDGHGEHGDFISDYVKESIPKLIIRHKRFKTGGMGHMLIDVFNDMQSILNTADQMKKISAQRSGTTATVCIHDHVQKKLYLAHVADSTAVLISRSGENLVARALTRDHKPELHDEKRRIEQSGGEVTFDGYASFRAYVKGEQYPGLNMSRCIGHLVGHAECGLSCQPEILELDLKDNDIMLLLCCDGVWEFIAPHQSVDLVEAYTSDKAMDVAEHLADEAWYRWFLEEDGTYTDDLTAVVVFFTQKGPSP